MFGDKSVLKGPKEDVVPCLVLQLPSLLGCARSAARTEPCEKTRPNLWLPRDRHSGNKNFSRKKMLAEEEDRRVCREHLRRTLHSVIVTHTDRSKRAKAISCVRHIIAILSDKNWSAKRLVKLGRQTHDNMKNVLYVLLRHPVRAFIRTVYFDEFERIDAVLLSPDIRSFI